MPMIPAQPDNGPAVTGTPTVPVDGGRVQGAWATAGGCLGKRDKKEPWETVVGVIAMARGRYTAFALVPAALFISAVFSRTPDEATRLLACAIVAGLFTAFVTLQTGWRMGCEQGFLDHAAVIDYHSAREKADIRRARTRRMVFSLPLQPNGEGYLYVVGFSTGTVKVGLTEDPKARLGNHRSWSAAFGVQVANYWISPSHLNFKDNETRLINACAKVSSRSRSEYFHEVGYAQAVQFANALTYYSDNIAQTSVEGAWA